MIKYIGLRQKQPHHYICILNFANPNHILWIYRYILWLFSISHIKSYVEGPIKAIYMKLYRIMSKISTVSMVKYDIAPSLLVNENVMSVRLPRGVDSYAGHLQNIVTIQLLQISIITSDCLWFYFISYFNYY